MGNKFHIKEEEFRIPRGKVPEAFNTLKEFTINPKNWTNSEGGFYCIGPEAIEMAKIASTFNELLNVWFWRVDFNVGCEDIIGIREDIIGIRPITSYAGDDELMLSALAPFVDDGSFLHIVDDYGEYKLLFKNGEMKHITPKWE